MVEEIEELVRLRQEGRLSDDEFVAAKRQVLGLDHRTRSSSPVDVGDMTSPNSLPARSVPATPAQGSEPSNASMPLEAPDDQAPHRVRAAETWWSAAKVLVGVLALALAVQIVIVLFPGITDPARTLLAPIAVLSPIAWGWWRLRQGSSWTTVFGAGFVLLTASLGIFGSVTELDNAQRSETPFVEADESVAPAPASDETEESDDEGVSDPVESDPRSDPDIAEDEVEWWEELPNPVGRCLRDFDQAEYLSSEAQSSAQCVAGWLESHPGRYGNSDVTSNILPELFWTANWSWVDSEVRTEMCRWTELGGLGYAREASAHLVGDWNDRISSGGGNFELDWHDFALDIIDTCELWDGTALESR